MNGFVILLMEDAFGLMNPLDDLTEELRKQAPQIEWSLNRKKVLDIDDQYTEKLCLLVPDNQYEAADYLVEKIQYKERVNSGIEPMLEEWLQQLNELVQFCSAPVMDEKEKQSLQELLGILSSFYDRSARMPGGVNLHLPDKDKEACFSFPELWMPDADFFPEEIEDIQKNISQILNETSPYFPIKSEDILLEAGIVHQIHTSFYTEYGWGVRLLETMKLIQQVFGRIEQPSKKQPRLRQKALAISWIKQIIEKNRLLIEEEYGCDEYAFYSFSPEGIEEELEVFFQIVSEGIQLGHHTIFWEGHHPEPIFKTTRLISWETLRPLNMEEKEAELTSAFLKVIALRKLQFRACQFCGGRFPPEQRFNRRTCYSCASRQYGIVY